MPITIACPACGKKLSARDDQAGKRFKCPSCGGAISVPGGNSAVSTRPTVEMREPAPAASAAVSSRPTIAMPDLPRAAAPARPTAPAPPAAAAQPVTLHVTYPGQYFLFDVTVEILLDGQAAGSGYIMKGVDLRIPTTVGSHTLEVRFMGKAKSYTVHLVAPGTYEAQLIYSKLWGNFAEDLKLQGPPGAQPHADSGRAAVGGVTAGGRFFTCSVPNTGALGLSESTLIVGDTAYVGQAGAPTLRKATVKLQDGVLTLSCEDAQGAWHEVSKMPAAQVASVEKSIVTRSQQWGMAFLRVLGMTFGLALVIMVGIAANIGFGKFLQDMARNPGILLGIGFFVLICGLVIAALVVLIPAALKIKQNLTRLVFHTPAGPGFSVLTTPEELTQAAATLEAAGIKLATS